MPTPHMAITPAARDLDAGQAGLHCCRIGKVKAAMRQPKFLAKLGELLFVAARHDGLHAALDGSFNNQPPRVAVGTVNE